ncbi:MAG: hypothetical protein GX610_18370 [Rhodococcus sp.]|nr:hypothetical protein [Rhodococcus sp. (in: high G+C Gram-positive bacteria)]
MTAPVTFNVNSDQLRGLGSAWTRLGDAIENLDPGGAITSRAGSVPDSATAEVMGTARELVNGGIDRTAARLQKMADAAVHTADTTEAQDESFAAALGRIDGQR